MNNKETWAVIIILMGVGYALGLISGDYFFSSKARREEHRAAYEAGVGKYVSDPATGEQRFVYGEDGK